MLRFGIVLIALLPTTRVTRQAGVADFIFLLKFIDNLYRGKSFVYFCILKKLPKVSNKPIGENSPNLVTLPTTDEALIVYTLHEARIQTFSFSFLQGVQIGRIFAHLVIV
jgi:hypothetical protein